MDVKNAITSLGKSQNSAGAFYWVFPYTSSIGNQIEQLYVQVPTKSEVLSESDLQALIEAVNVQGALGKWLLKEDGTAWLVRRDD